jgi:hypothetical protein
VSVGDPLGVGSRQDSRASLGAEYSHPTMQVMFFSYSAMSNFFVSLAFFLIIFM